MHQDPIHTGIRLRQQQQRPQEKEENQETEEGLIEETIHTPIGNHYGTRSIEHQEDQ